MSDIINPIIAGKAFQDLSFAAGVLCFIFAAVLLVWLYRDARSRGATAAVWTVAGVVAGLVAALVGLSFPKFGFGPVGVFAILALAVVALLYIFIRPGDFLANLREQQLSLQLLEAQIEQETCPTCGNGIETRFLVCPSCNTTLRVPCDYCGQPIKPTWTICPYCKANQRQHFEENKTFIRPPQDPETFTDEVEDEKPAPAAPRKTTRTRSAR